MDLEERLKALEEQIGIPMLDLAHLQQQLAGKDAEIAELKAISAAWMGSGGENKGRSGKGAGGEEGVRTRAQTETEVYKDSGMKTLERIYRGGQVRMHSANGCC